jgi:hypothetical protein
MTIIYTIEEAQKRLAQLGSNPVFDDKEPTVQIVSPDPEHPVNVLVYEMLCLVRSFDDYRGSNKIFAIKALREYAKTNNFEIDMGQAKMFVESV